MLKKYFHDNTALRYFVIYSSPLWPRVSTLNYGYSPVNQQVLDHKISKNQAFQIELYRQVFLNINEVLTPEQCICEISCGRGGGLAFIAGLTPARCIGLEKSCPARLFARRRFGLDVRKSIAPVVTLPAASVDAFISVEAFHNYANDHFLQEVARCLRPGGRIVVADRRRGSVEENRQFHDDLLKRNGFEMQTFRDITPNILAALREDFPRKAAFLRYVSGTFIYDELTEMFACPGSRKYAAFENGSWSYFLFSATRSEAKNQNPVPE